MKKTLVIIILAFVLMFLMSCQSNEEEEEYNPVIEDTFRKISYDIVKSQYRANKGEQFLEIIENGEAINYRVIRTQEELLSIYDENQYVEQLDENNNVIALINYNNYILDNEIRMDRQLDHYKYSINFDVPRIFLGCFNGNGYFIDRMITPTEKNSSIFGTIGQMGNQGGVVKDLLITGTIGNTSLNLLDSPIANVNYGLIFNVHNGTSRTHKSGLVTTNLGTIENCINYAQVFSNNGDIIAGIAVYNYGIIKNSTNYGAIITENKAAGITAILYSKSQLINCNNYGTVIYSDPNGMLNDVYTDKESDAIVENCIQNSALYNMVIK